MNWWRRLPGRHRLDRELDAELRDHLERLAADYVRGGASPADARRRARLTFGGDDVAEACRDARGTRWVESLARDVRVSVRGLLASRTFTTIALAVLAISIGATATIFSVVDAVVLRPLPFERSDRLVALTEAEGTNVNGNVAPQNFLEWRERQTSFSDLAAIAWGGQTVDGDGSQEPETLSGRQVTASFFTVLGTPPILGRPFTAENEVDGNARVVVISYRLWQHRFGGTPDIIGRQLHGQLATLHIVGVMPPGFSYPVGARDASDVWTPLVIPAEDHVRGHSYGYPLEVIGRLRDGMTVDAAQAEMTQIAGRLKTEAPSWFRRVTVQPLHTYVTGPVRTWMMLLLGAVACVLLIACVNLATLMLVRATTRAHEIGVRSALGASRWDLVRALGVESLVLSFGGAALGTVVAFLGVEVLRAALPADMPRVETIAIDGRVLAATAVAAVAIGLGAGLAPTWRVTRRLTRSLRDRGRHNTAGLERQRLRSALVIIEVALAATLLVGAGLFLASFAQVNRVNLGVDTQDVLTVRVRPLVGGWNADRARRENRDLLFEVLKRTQALPGVQAAALVGGGLPFRGDLQTADFAIPGRTLRPGLDDIDRNQISPGYFATLRVPLRRGRVFTDADRQGAEPVVILNDTAARTYFPNEGPIGRIVTFEGNRRVVGVVGDIRHDGPESDWRREGFIPLAQSGVFGATLVLRTSAPLQEILPPVKAAIWSQFPNLALPDIEMLADYVRQLTAQRRLNMLLLGLFGLLGLSIASVGLYGVMAYVVTQRTPEIGIRMALGAEPAAIRRSVLGRALRQLSIGLAIGVAGAWMLSTLVANFLFDVAPHDVRIYLAAAAVLILAGLGAALLPAHRASRVDPVIALRAE